LRALLHCCQSARHIAATVREQWRVVPSSGAGQQRSDQSYYKNNPKKHQRFGNPSEQMAIARLYQQGDVLHVAHLVNQKQQKLSLHAPVV